MAAILTPLLTETTTTDATPQRPPAFTTQPGDAVRSAIRVMAVSDDNHVGTWNVDAIFINIAGELTLTGFLKGGIINDNISKNWDVTLQIRPEDHNSLEFLCTGDAMHTIRWVFDGVFNTLSVGS